MAVVIAIFGALVTLTVAQVFMRYVVGHAFMWGDELMRVLLIWGVLLAGGLAFYYHRHLALDYLLVKLPPLPRKIVETAIWLSIILIGCFFVYHGSILAMNNIVQKLPTLHFSMFYVQIALPVSACLWIIFSINNIYCLLTGKALTPLHEDDQAVPKKEE